MGIPLGCDEAHTGQTIHAETLSRRFPRCFATEPEPLLLFFRVCSRSDDCPFDPTNPALTFRQQPRPGANPGFLQHDQSTRPSVTGQTTRKPQYLIRRPEHLPA